MTLTPLLIAVTIGFLSSIHCVSMCGGIMGALVMGLSPEKRASSRSLVPLLLSYNLGRITSYFIAGALVAGVLGSVMEWMPVGNGHSVLRVLAGVLMLMTGLYLAGWYPGFVNIERLGVPVWKAIEPYGRRLVPVRSLSGAMLYGMVWGWLPCGLVYTVLFTAAGQGDALSGGLFMLAFGLGTLPSVLIAGLLTGRMVHLHRIRYLKQVGGGVVIVLALVTLIVPGVGAPDAIEALCAIPQR